MIQGNLRATTGRFCACLLTLLVSSMVWGPPAHAATFTVDPSLPDGGDCTLPPINGTWTAVTDTCTTSGGFTLGAGDRLRILDDAQLRNSGEIVSNNGGVITNRGNLINNNGGTIINNNGGDFTNGGTIINNNGGTIINNGYFEPGQFTNFGNLVHNFGGLFFFFGNLINNNGGTIDITGEIFISGTIINNNGGTFNNFSGLFFNESSISNFGTFNNHGNLDNFQDIINNDGGTINNFGNIFNIEFHNSSISNFGTINNHGLIDNRSSIIINNNGGTIDNFGNIINEEIEFVSSTIINFGTINNHELIDNRSSIINNGFICNLGVITGTPVVGNPPDIDSDGDGVCDTQQCPDPNPATQGYWHRQCLGVPASEGGIDPGRNGRGPQSPTEPGFNPGLMDCAFSGLENSGVFGTTTCEGMDADPPSDACEKAEKQLTALILNVCSGRLADGCEVDVSAEGCMSTTVGGLVVEVGGLIGTGFCQQAKSCAAAVNEGIGLVGGGGASDSRFLRPIERKEKWDRGRRR